MVIADPNEVLSIIKLRFNITDKKLDSLVDSYIREIGRRIRHYCNIPSIPEELTDVWASMVMDVLRIEQPETPGIEENVVGDANVKVGDTSISSAARTGEVTASSKKTIEEIVVNYKADLGRYRKVRWLP